MNPIEWLEKNEWGFKTLPQEDRDAIMHFTLLWSLFEARVLCTHASAKKIIAVSKEWENKGWLKAESFRKRLEYFQNRYLKNGVFTQHFRDLKFQANDHQPLVEAVLKGENTNVGDIAAALLIIVYRLRNNLFHGVKWADGIRGQRDNFENANSLLMDALDLHKRKAAPQPHKINMQSP